MGPGSLYATCVLSCVEGGADGEPAYSISLSEDFYTYGIGNNTPDGDVISFTSTAYPSTTLTAYEGGTIITPTAWGTAAPDS